MGQLDEEFNFQARLLISKSALSSYFNESSIILGLGADSFPMKYTIIGGPNDWIHNTFIAALHDGGILAFSLFLLGWCINLISAYRLMNKVSSEISIRVNGLWLAGWTLLLTGNSNNFSWMTLYWIYFGLLAAGVKILRAEIRLRRFNSSTNI
jgi:hypothetical protein